MNWIKTHWAALTPKAKTILVAAIGYAGTMSIPQAKAWVSSNLGQHPTITAFATSIIAIVSLYQQPFVQNALNSLHVNQKSPNEVVVTSDKPAA